MEEIRTKRLLDLKYSVAGEYLEQYDSAFEIIPHIGEIICRLFEKIDKNLFYSPCEGVWISKTAKVAETACVMPPCLIMHGAEVRHCSFIRGNVVVGERCVVGNSTELKNCILFDEAQVPHFNYVGDSLLGRHAHMGAGAIISNLKSDRSDVCIKFGNGKTAETHLRKMGAILGDFAEVGCNSVLNPGTVVGRHSTVYPTSCVRGVIPENSIYKNADNIIIKNKSEGE